MNYRINKIVIILSCFVLLILMGCAGNNGISYTAFAKRYGDSSFYEIFEPASYFNDEIERQPAGTGSIRIFHNGGSDTFTKNYTVRYKVYDDAIKDFLFLVRENENSEIILEQGEYIQSYEGTMLETLYGIDGGQIGVIIYTSGLISQLTELQRSELEHISIQIIEDSLNLNSDFSFIN